MKNKAKNTKNSGKAKQNIIYSPVSGILRPLAYISDGVFSVEALGKGAAVEPAEGKIFSPCDGRVSVPSDCANAVGVTSDSGMEILIHVGIDTSALNGICYNTKVKAGDKVKTGQLLMEFDIAGIERAGGNSITPVTVKNSDEYSDFSIADTGAVWHGDKLMEINI